MKWVKEICLARGEDLDPMVNACDLIDEIPVGNVENVGLCRYKGTQRVLFFIGCWRKMLFFRLLSWWCEHCEEDKRVWQEMKERTVIKLYGCSWVEINCKDHGIEIKN